MDLATISLAVDSSQVTKATAELNKLVPAADKAGNALKPLAPTSKLNADQLRNMSFQMNDMATMLASGQSPFVMLMQQGMQVAQIFKPGTGLAAAFRMTGVALLSFITNPLTLAVIGFAAAAGAASFFYKVLMKDGESAADVLKRHDDLIRHITKATDEYNQANTRAGNTVNTLIVRALAEQLELTEKIRRSIDDIGKSPIPDWLRTGGMTNPITAGILTGIDSVLDLKKRLDELHVPQGLKDEWARLNSEVDANKLSMTEAVEALTKIGAAFPTSENIAFINSVIKATEESIEYEAALDALGISVRKLKSEVMPGGQVQSMFANNNALAMRFGTGFGALDAITKGNKKFSRDDDSEAKRAQKKIDEVVKSLSFAQTQIGRTAREQEQYNALQRAGIDVNSKYAAGIMASAGALYDLQTLYGNTNEITHTFFDLLRSGLREGKDLWQSFGDAAVGVLDRISQKLVDAAADTATDWLFDLLKGGTGSGGIGGILSWILGSANGNVFNNGRRMTAFANGGVVDRPTLFPMANGAGLMGEAGPEAIMPLKRGQDGKLGIAGGSGALTINIDARGAGPGVGREIEEHVRRAIDNNNRFKIPTMIHARKNATILATGKA